MFSLFELVWKRIRLFFTDDEVFLHRRGRCTATTFGAGTGEPLSYCFKRAAWGQ